LILSAAVIAKAWHDTMRDPVVQRVELTSDSIAPGDSPLTIALLSDIHVAGPDMPPDRLARIVEQVNALNPDLVVIAGDLISDKYVSTRHYSAKEVIAPLGKLAARYGVVIVPGNHDHWFDWPALAAQIARYPNLSALRNEAAQFGPFAVGGIDDAYTDRDDVEATMAQLAPLPGIKVALSHSPDIFPQVPVDVPLVLAGHTHCGQIGYPWGGAPKTLSEYGDLYACGVVKEHGKTLVTSAGLGTSILPFRLFTQPEIWMVKVRGSGQ
jgi:predicted MPP superfamily phosphohydrolase